MHHPRLVIIQDPSTVVPAAAKTPQPFFQTRKPASVQPTKPKPVTSTPVLQSIVQPLVQPVLQPQSMYPVDPYCTVSGVSVYQDYTCMLNQTDIQKNANKFYAIQLLTNGACSSYYVLTRYGRVGEKGRVDIKTFNSDYDARVSFIKTYYDKTGYTWTNYQRGWVDPIHYPKCGKYVHMQMEAPQIKEIKITTQVPSQLDSKVQSLIGLISSRQLLERTMEMFEIDTQRLPLGKISNQQIGLGQIKLMEIQSAIHQADRGRMMSLSSEFWTIIPFATKRNRPPPVIETMEQLQTTVEMLDTLKQIGYAGRVIEQHSNIDDIYRSLNVDIGLVDVGSAEWNQLSDYIQNTHAPTHHYKLRLMNVYKISKPQHDLADPNNIFGTIGNHKLLIHGSRMTNFVGIMTEGLRIPKREHVANGTMFGLGVYYADSISKSFNYCYAQDTANKGLIVLCEVALGNSQMVQDPIDDDGPGAPYNSRSAEGKSIPNPVEAQKWVCNAEVEVPTGHLIRSPKADINQLQLRYNEYIIYRPEQYRFRYILELDSY